MEMQRYLWKQIFVLALDATLCYFGIYSLPAYMPHLMHHLGVPITNVGYKVGAANNIILASAAVGTVAAGVLQSYISPRRLLVGSLCLNGFLCIFYGLSKSLTFLLISLAPIGLVGGVVTVCVNTVISNKCNESGQTYIMAWTVAGPNTVSAAFAPALAGYISFPAEKYPLLFSNTGVFKAYPILLFQVIMGGSLVLLSLISHLSLDDQYLCQDYDAQDPFQNTNYSILEEDITEDNSYEESLDSTEKSKVKVFFDIVLLNPCCIGALLGKALFVGCDVAYISLVPLWLQTPRSSFGRNYNTNHVGDILIISGAMASLLSYTVLAKINSMMDSKVALAK